MANETTIRELTSGSAWRKKIKPAQFRSAPFHVETGTKESGRRIVAHQFPKRDIGYAEDMGRRAIEFTIRGYIIVYPSDSDSDKLKKKDYIPARDELIKALEQEGPGELQMPLLGKLKVAVQRYRVTEEKQYGGYCVFDITFIEFGQVPGQGSRNSGAVVDDKAKTLDSTVTSDVTQAVDNTAFDSRIQTGGIGRA